MKPLRLILAGAGAFGREHLTRLLAREDVAVADVADPGDRTRTNIAKQYSGLRVASDPLVLIDEAKPDGVIVASSASSHFDIAAHAVVRGIPVLLEKPVTPSVDQGLQLATLAEKNGTFILQGHVLRFSKDHQAIAEIVKSGVIGNVIYLNSR